MKREQIVVYFLNLFLLQGPAKQLPVLANKVNREPEIPEKVNFQPNFPNIDNYKQQDRIYQEVQEQQVCIFVLN